MLVELDAVVHFEEGIILTAHSAQQLAVPDPGSTAAGNGVYNMTTEFIAQACLEGMVLGTQDPSCDPRGSPPSGLD